MSRRRKIVLGLFALPILGFIIIQFVPAGNFIQVLRREANPPAEIDIVWDSPETERLVKTACFDCHSNETVWPWYSQIAPVSWFITRDVNKGRRAMNFSEEGSESIDANDVEWHITHDMPLWYYLPLHPGADLTDAEKAQVVAGLRAMYGSDDEGGMEMGSG